MGDPGGNTMPQVWTLRSVAIISGSESTRPTTPAQGTETRIDFPLQLLALPLMQIPISVLLPRRHRHPFRLGRSHRVGRATAQHGHCHRDDNQDEPKFSCGSDSLSQIFETDPTPPVIASQTSRFVETSRPPPGEHAPGGKKRAQGSPLPSYSAGAGVDGEFFVEATVVAVDRVDTEREPRGDFFAGRPCTKSSSTSRSRGARP